MIKSEKWKWEEAFTKIITKIWNELKNHDFKGLSGSYELLKKEIQTSNDYFDKEGYPVNLIKVMTEIEDGLNKGATGIKLSKDNEQNLKTMKNKYKKYLLTLSEELKQELIKFRATGQTEK